MTSHQSLIKSAQQAAATTALPISVTTSSHADPSTSRSPSKPTQQTVLAIGQPLAAPGPPQPTHVTNPQVQSKMVVVAQHPVAQIVPNATKAVPALSSSGFAPPGSGITLPGHSMRPLIRPSISLAVPIVHSPPPPPPLRCLQPLAEQRQPQQGAGPKLSLGNKSVVYSAAGRASVSAQAHEAASNRAKAQGIVSQIGRRINSAPSELAKSVTGGQSSTFKYRKVVGGKAAVPRSQSMVFRKEIAPQVFLDKMLNSRGYCTRNFCSLEGGYYCKPTPLQKASYGIRIVQAVRASDADTLAKLLKCGLSPNSCNAFGESVVHMVCRRGDYKLLKLLIDNGCSLQVTDDFGRTPLHDACWTAKPNFEIVELILNTDVRLLHLVDCRGSSPLSYVKRDQWQKWIEFFKSKVEIYWSPRDVEKAGEEPPPPLVNEPPHSKPIKDPEGAIAIEIAEKISAGRLEPDEILCKRESGDEEAGRGEIVTSK